MEERIRELVHEALVGYDITTGIGGSIDGRWDLAAELVEAIKKLTDEVYNEGYNEGARDL